MILTTKSGDLLDKESLEEFNVTPKVGIIHRYILSSAVVYFSDSLPSKSPIPPN